MQDVTLAEQVRLIPCHVNAANMFCLFSYATCDNDQIHM